MATEDFPEQYPITTSYHNGVASITAPEGGRIDVYSCDELRRQIIEAVNAESTSIVVDLSKTEFIDSSGISVLVGAVKQLRRRAIPMVVDYSNQLKVQKVFRLTNVVDVFQLVTSREEYNSQTKSALQ